MGDDRVGRTSVGKSVRSLLEALRSLEHEVKVLLQRLTDRPSDGLRSAARLLSTISRGAGTTDFLKFFLPSGDSVPVRAAGGRLADLFGLADEASLAELRSRFEALLDDVVRLRERETVLASGLSQLRARAARFDDALAGLARIQGRLAARIGAEKSRTDRTEHLASRRDDHITRLIRDTAAQRSRLEHLVSQLEDERRQRAGQSVEVGTSARVVDERVVAVERQFDDLRKGQKSATQGVIEALEALRERLSRLESRSIEMTREARVKTGRIDALARHVSSVEGRLTTAIGPGSSVTVAPAADLGQT